MRSNLTDIDMHLHVDRPKAILASDDGDREHAVWLPKSEIEIEHKGDRRIVVTMPQWLAEEKGLV